jgi:glycosyltransferase involved in cell wall biosynthesis
LFPGESERDAEYEGHRESGVAYLIDPLHPLTWQRAVRQFVEAGVQAAIFPWWTVYFSPCFLYLKRALQSRGIPVVFLCHNVMDHETATYKRVLSRLVLAGAHGYCTQARGEAEKLKQFLPGARVIVHQHPLYDQFPRPSGAFPRRAGLELLFFGFVRPYKGVDVLLEAMAALERNDVRLSIVGEFWDEKKTTLQRIDALGLSTKVEVVPRFVNEREAAEYFARADVVVLPYRHATGSGIVAMAYHYGKPVIASRIGGLAEAVRHGKTGYHVEPGSPRPLADVIEQIRSEALEAMGPHIEAAKAEMTWEGLADAILSLIDRDPYLGALVDGPSSA